jgi:putative ABC transport system ATP-binding protein
VQEKKNSEGSPPFGGWGAGKEDGRKKTKDKRKKTKGKRQKEKDKRQDIMLEIKNITRKYKKGEDIFTALDNVTLTIDKGEFVAVYGPSGSGKSTLLHTAGGLTPPDSGQVLYFGKNIYELNGKESDQYRKFNVSFVFQQFHLIPYLTLHDNVMMACNDEIQRTGIDSLLKSCSMYGHRNKYPSELSVGEKQRTAFIRAMISEPSLLLADEPTGNLDPENREILYSLIKDYHNNGGTVLLVSHDPEAMKFADRTVLLRAGRIS